MDDLISRKALMEEAHWVIRSDGSRVFVVHAEDIENAHAVESAPVRRGRWIDDSIPMHTDAYWKCSICGGHDDDTYDYCHHCGAKMEVDHE